MAICFLLSSCTSDNTNQIDNTEQTDNNKESIEYSHVDPPRRIYWSSFEEIAELKDAVKHKDEKAFFDYLENNDNDINYRSNGFYSKEDVNKFFEQFSQKTTFSLDENCKLKLAGIHYDFETNSFNVMYQEGSGSTFKHRIEFRIYATSDGQYTAFSDQLSEFTEIIDSIDIASTKINLYASNSYESNYGTVMCNFNCFEMNNSYILIAYNTVDESAVLDPCIKEHLQMTSLNELIGEYSNNETSSNIETSRKIRWGSFEEITELKEALVEYGDADFYDYFKENAQSENFEDDFDSIFVIEDFFEKINQKTAVLLDKDCKFKFEEIVYDYDADSLTISYREEGEAAFKRRIEFTTLFTDDNFKRYSDFLSEFDQIDSINIESQKIDLYATGSYESKYHTVMCSRGCFETDNSYIAINYNTANESAVLDPCIKEHLQITSLNELIG